VPGLPKTIMLRRRDPTARFEGTLEALNVAERMHLPSAATPESAQGDLGRV